MAESLHQKFIQKLESKYGKWEKVTSKFGQTSFGKIAEDLCIGKSQFSMLISGGATEGMYIRSIRNIEQLIEFGKQKEQLEELKQKTKDSKGWLKYLAIGILSLMLGGFIAKSVLKTNPNEPLKKETSLDTHPLSNYFDGDFKEDYVAPYLKESEVQSYCPCNAYEGVWELENEYIIPLPSKKRGLYYVGKSSDVRMKCNKSAEDKGTVLLGFENMKNELWIDVTQTPFFPKYFNTDSKTYTEDFLKLDMGANPNFLKIADVYSCFFDVFDITADTIFRRGEPCGRRAEIVNQELADKYEIDVMHVLENTISSMAEINCNPMSNIYCNPNDLVEEKSTMEFDCMFSIKTENLGLGGGYPYKKGYRLVKQNYADNLLCQCEK